MEASPLNFPVDHNTAITDHRSLSSPKQMVTRYTDLLGLIDGLCSHTVIAIIVNVGSLSAGLLTQRTWFFKTSACGLKVPKTTPKYITHGRLLNMRQHDGEMLLDVFNIAPWTQHSDENNSEGYRHFSPSRASRPPVRANSYFLNFPLMTVVLLRSIGRSDGHLTPYVQHKTQTVTLTKASTATSVHTDQQLPLTRISHVIRSRK